MSGLPAMICTVGLRMCGALTVPGPANPLNVLINNVPAAVAGDLDSHGNLGALISLASGMAGGKGIMVGGIPLIVTLLDQGSPDVLGIIPHVTGLPTPAQGSPTVMAYGMISSMFGKMGGGQGHQSGQMQTGEPVTVGGQPAGDIHRVVSGGSAGFDVLVLANTNSLVNTSVTVTGVTSGNTFTFSNYYSS